ncbi:hypothetical protein DC498_16560 [Terrimonas sp.]|uniref:gliding motility lipoprotein GldB n=1 Tax=Terrimonas sp. TaxID=1914338 RepID=UPI000D50B8DC|nr:hypothetical protein [Terrimonas sp.]PVD51128.1 hypothetical protein DC498_16560 [Terrimonas sp.]
MRKTTIIFLTLLLFFVSCKDGKQTPDVSGIKVNLQTQRFEKDFFSIDTNNVPASFPLLQQKYPVFFADFIQNILGLSVAEDGSKAEAAIKSFLRDYHIVKDTADKVFADFSKIENEVKQGIRFAKHYFPAYHAPEKIITFIGPLDAIFQTPTGKTGDVITQDALAVGLQLHLGSEASLYQSQAAQSLFPKYVSAKFSPQYIPVNCLKNIVDDIYPPNPNDKTLLDFCIDKGKRLYLLDKFMPETPDTLKIGYTANQLTGCYKNEGLIWSFLIQNNLLYNSDFLRIQSYVEEGPQTQELGEGSPGQISLFVGWQIVKKYMEKHPYTTLDTLLKLDAKQILAESKYKPK